MKKHCVPLPGLNSPNTWSKQVTTAFKSAKLNIMFVTLGWWLPSKVGAILSPGVIWEHFWLSHLGKQCCAVKWTPLLRGISILGYGQLPYLIPQDSKKTYALTHGGTHISILPRSPLTSLASHHLES